MIAAFVVIVALGAAGWWCAVIGIRAMGQHMKDKNCTPPTGEEIGACVHEVVKGLFSKKT